MCFLRFVLIFFQHKEGPAAALASAPMHGRGVSDDERPLQSVLTRACCAQQDAQELDAQVRRLYARDATWEDPLTSAAGVESIVANYRSLAAIASEATLSVKGAALTLGQDGPDLR